MNELRGDPIHGEVVSADASAGVAFKLYKSGETTEYTLLTTEFVYITDIDIVTEAGGDIGIFADTDAVGRRVLKADVAPNSGIIRSYSTPRACPKSVVPKLIADAGNVVGIIHGYITGA